MPMPTPNDFKNLIVSATGGTCEKMRNLFALPRKFSEWYSSFFNADATGFTDEVEEMICAAKCTGDGNDANPNMPSPTGISASDGTYSDKVTVTWNAVVTATGIAAVTAYKVYRALSTITDPNSATLIATVTAPTVTYDDTSAVQGTTYNYWVVATNGTDTSNFGGPDVGNAGAPTTTLPAISDLRCSKGFNDNTGGVIALVWTPPTGATKYAIYRNTVNDSGTATLVLDNAVPTLASSTFSNVVPPIYDNVGEIVYYDTPPSSNTKYYYWVIAKKDAPPAVSPFSNTDIGWDSVLVAPYLVSSARLGRNDTMAVPGGCTKMYVVLFGGGGGAGAGQVYGGGGGGGGGVVIEEFTVVPGDTLLVEASPNSETTGNAATTVDGTDGSDTLLKINTVLKMTANNGDGGNYNPAGGGTGGAGGSGSGTGSPLVYAGGAGGAASGGVGGASGYAFSQRRFPPAWYNGFAPFTSWDGNAVGPGFAGGGSYPNASAPSLAVGGYGYSGYAVIGFGA